MSTQLRVGIIGAGMMGREHIRNLKLTPQARVTALADPHPPSLEAALETLGPAAEGVAIHADAASLLASGEADAVLVVSPNHTHREVLEQAFTAGIHILCEKPLCTTIDDARWATERAARSDRVFWTGMEYRFMPPAARLVADVHAGRIGPLRMLSLREHRFPFLEKVGDWNRFAANTGGTMVEKCCHFFDLMRLITRSEPARIFCSGGMDVNHLNERYDGRTPDILDNSYTVVDFENGVRALLDLCMFADGAEEQEEIVAVGDLARIETSIPRGELTWSPRTPYGGVKRPVREAVVVDADALEAGTHHGATLYQLRAFLDACAGAAPVQVTAEDGLKSVAMGVAAERSAKERRVVEMSELGF